MMAKRLPSILPDMTRGEALACTERYRRTDCSVQVHRPEGWPYQPHLHGFMAHTSMNRLG